MIAYNPLAGGLLTGKHRNPEQPTPGTRFTLGKTGGLYRERYWHEAQFAAIETLKSFCAERALNLATASVAWVLAQPGITSAIVGASRPEQIDEPSREALEKATKEESAAEEAGGEGAERRPSRPAAGGLPAHRLSRDVMLHPLAAASLIGSSGLGSAACRIGARTCPPSPWSSSPLGVGTGSATTLISAGST